MIRIIFILSFIFILFSCNDNSIDEESNLGKFGYNCRVDKSCNDGLACVENKCIKKEDNPCKNISCSNHGSCIVEDGKTKCDCEVGYYADGNFCRIEDLCTDISCSNHGSCVVENNAPKCNCEDGYHTLDLYCISDNNPCNDINCSDHGSCIVENDFPKCDCEDGYHATGLSCTKDIDPCENFDCSDHGSCRIENNLPKCDCEVAYSGDNCSDCATGYHEDGANCIIDDNNPCNGVTCDSWKECNTNNGACELKVGRCDITSDCNDSNLICDNHNCINPCDGVSCSDHGSCRVENGIAECNCSVEYTGLDCSNCATGYHEDGNICIIDNNNPCNGVTCDSWKECNTNNGVCELKVGRCDITSDCNDSNLVCDNHSCINPCDGVSCSNHGSCRVENGIAVCNCSVEYTGLDCSNCATGYHEDGNICIIDNNNPCNGVTCDSWKECNTNNGVCELKVGRCDITSDCNNANLVCDNHSCINPCTNYDCQPHATCNVFNNRAVCNCVDGYHDENGSCVSDDLCDNVICDSWKECNSNDGNCYLKSGMCNSTSDCNGDLVCYSHSCVDPCSTYNCSTNEECYVENQEANCRCKDGYRTVNNSCTDNTVIPGITSYITVNPTVMIGYADFLRYAYKIIFNRDYDIAGFNYWKRQLEIGATTESQIYEVFLGSTEVANSTTLKSKRDMIIRAYRLMFNRTAQSSDINYWEPKIRNYDGTGTGFTWYEFYHILTEGQEYKDNNCDTQYYSYGKKLNNRTPLLQDLFTGAAYFQPINQSTTVNISVQNNGGYNMMWDIGLPIVYDKRTASYYAYNRVYNETTQKFNIVTSKSTNGVNFTQYGGMIFENSQNVLTLYDPHVVPDYLTCPKRYTMTFECNNIDGVGGANLCMSYTTRPDRLETWSYPKNVIKGYNMNGQNKSASTGVSISDTQNRYLSWTVVDDSTTGADEGNESTYVRGMRLNSYFNLEEYSTTGTLMLSSEPNINCVGEECNNRDQTDWKKEDGKYYLIYNGANYYRCIRPGHANLNDGSSDWRIKIRRSTNAISTYNEVADTIMHAERTDICGISYAKVNEFNGELYLYVAYYPTSGGNKLIRSKLVWR